MCIPLRYEVLALSEDLEIEMQYLESQGIILKGKSWSWMKKELVKARKEVDDALKNNDGFELAEKALLHEAMILAIVREYLSRRDPMWDIPNE